MGIKVSPQRQSPVSPPPASKTGPAPRGSGASEKHLPESTFEPAPQASKGVDLGGVWSTVKEIVKDIGATGSARPGGASLPSGQEPILVEDPDPALHTF